MIKRVLFGAFILKIIMDVAINDLMRNEIEDSQQDSVMELFGFHNAYNAICEFSEVVKLAFDEILIKGKLIIHKTRAIPLDGHRWRPKKSACPYNPRSFVRQRLDFFYF